MEALTSKSKFPILETVKINLKHNTVFSIVVSVVLMFCIPLIVGTANLDAHSSAIPLEMFVSLIGIVMLTPVFQPEQNMYIDDLISSKYVSKSKIYLIRTVYSSIILTLLIVIFCFYMSIRNCDVTFRLVAGTVSDAIFLGSLGMITSSICNNTVIAYMIPTVYYAANYGMGDKLKNYWLFSMRVGDFSPKIWILITGILLITGSIILKEVQKKFR